MIYIFCCISALYCMTFLIPMEDLLKKVYDKLYAKIENAENRDRIEKIVHLVVCVVMPLIGGAALYFMMNNKGGGGGSQFANY